ncbi:MULTISPECIES: alpha/beta hydrolase fold domain-containing protein [Robertmurraya]|uniref:Alpha/beta hydrolase fold domain-containing protein n=1 Tax=Robertmurraya beringensis TaxID=641660 RepID=A0ABV6KRL5_9BACI
MKFKKRTFFITVLLTLLLSTSVIAGALNSTSKQLEVPIQKLSVSLISDVVYSQPSIFGYPNYPLKMDILKPNSKDLLPAVVFITGGGFMAANKDNYLQQRMDISEAGYVVTSIEYRVTPQSTFPAPLEDVKSAIRYLRANSAKYGIDPNQIAVMGSSAGGYLAALAGTTNNIKEYDKGDFLDVSSKVNAVIDLYGLSDLTKVGEGYSKEVQEIHKSPSAPEAMWVNGAAVFGPGGSILDHPDKAAKANPITYVTNDDPPFLLMHGDQDTLVSPNQTQILHEALINKGVDSTRYVVKGAGHGGDVWAQPKIVNLIIDFLDSHLKGKENK